MASLHFEGTVKSEVIELNVSELERVLDELMILLLFLYNTSNFIPTFINFRLKVLLHNTHFQVIFIHSLLNYENAY